MHRSSGSLCAKVGKIRNLLQNWEFMALRLEKIGPKMTTQRQSADASSLMEKIVS